VYCTSEAERIQFFKAVLEVKPSFTHGAEGFHILDFSEPTDHNKTWAAGQCPPILKGHYFALIQVMTPWWHHSKHNN
jgi:hypothetical protein